MATVTNTIKLPDGSVPSYAAVVIELVASTTGRAAGWVTANDNTILSTSRPAVTAGAWSASLTPNADITRSGSVYKVTEYVDKTRYTHYIEVGSGGGSLFDLLVDPPASVATAALTSHMADVSAHAATSDRPDLYEPVAQHSSSRLVCGIDPTAGSMWSYNSAGFYQSDSVTSTNWRTKTLPTNVSQNPNRTVVRRYGSKIYLVGYNSSTTRYEVYSADPVTGTTAFTWSSTLLQLAANATVIGAAVHAGDSGFWVAEYSGSSNISSGPSLHRSTDGATFEVVLGPLASTRHLHAVAEDPYNAGHIYVTAGDTGSPCFVYKSTDNGDTFSEVLTDVEWQAVAIDFDADWVYFWSDQRYGGGNVYICDRATMTPQWLTTASRIDRIAVPGGVGGRVVTDLVTTSGDATVTSSSAAFTSLDVGKVVGGPVQIPLGAYIYQINSSTSVELSEVCSGSATGRTATIAGDQFYANAYNGAVDPDTGYVYAVACDASVAGTVGGVFVCTGRDKPWTLLHPIFNPPSGEISETFYIYNGSGFVGRWGPINLLTTA